MTGSVRKRGDNWYYYFSYEDETGTRRKVERKVGLNKKEAEKELRKAISEFENGYISDPHERVRGYLESWLTYVKENRKIATYNRYKGIMEKSVIPFIGNIKMKDLKSTHIEKIISNEKKRGVSNTTLEGLYLACNAAFTRAYKMRLLNENPCTFVEKPKRSKFTGTALKVDEINKVLNSINTDTDNGYVMHLALTLIFELGLRRGELAGLSWADIDMDNNLLTINNNMIYSHGHTYLTTPKTDMGKRTLYISDRLVLILKTHKRKQTEDRLLYGQHYGVNIFNEKEYVFVMVWPNGKYVHPNYYTTRIKKILNQNDLDGKIRFHDLRHTNATLMLEQGVDFKTMQIRLGHADISTTMDIYSHVNMQMQKKAVQMLGEALE